MPGMSNEREAEKKAWSRVNLTVHGDGALVDVVHAHEQAQQRALAAARGAHNGAGAAGRYVQAHPPQNAPVLCTSNTLHCSLFWNKLALCSSSGGLNQ